MSPAATLGGDLPSLFLPSRSSLLGLSPSHGGMVAARRPVSPPGQWHTRCPRRRFPTPGRGCGCRGAPGSPGAGRKQPAGPRAGAARSALTRDLAEPQHLVCSWSRAPLPRPGGTAGFPLLRGVVGDGMSLGIGVHRVLSCTASPSRVPAGEVGTHPALLSTFGCCSVPSPCPSGADATMRGARLAAVPVSVSPPRWHRGPLSGDGGGRGFPGCWHSSARAGTRREPGPLPPPHPAHQNLVKSAFCECSSPRGSS